MQDLTWPLRHAVRHRGNADAVVDGDTRLTFAQLGDRVHRIAAGLRSVGVERGTRVATLLWNSHRYLELHFAIPGSGAIIVPLNSRLAVPEMEYILEDAGVTHLVTDGFHAAVAEKLAPLVEQVIYAPSGYEELIARFDPSPLPGPESAEDPAGLYYTGGTTGPAKGVILSHRALLAETLYLGLGFRLEDDSRFLHVFPLFHLGGIGGLYGQVWSGAVQVFQPTVDPAAILDIIEREGITSTSMVPTIINAVISHPKAKTTDFSSLRRVAHGAAPISPDLCRRAVELLQCEFTQAYGMTEMSGSVTLLQHEEELLDNERVRSAGRAMVGLEVDVLRPDGSSCAGGETGEVVMRGPTMLSGYWNKPDETAAAVRHGWYHSGDLGYLDSEGYLFLVDRAKDMIVSGGENVYSIEVESALASHPSVSEVAVIGIPHETWGETVHAVVVLRPDELATEAELIEHCRDRIAGYKMPKSVELRDTELPKSAVGKVLKRELREPYWAGADKAIH